MSRRAAPFEFRVADARELDLLAELEARCFDDPWSRSDLEPLLDSGACEADLAVDENGAALGYALFQLLPGEVELLRIGTVPEARRRGIARELLTHALPRLAERGRTVCHLEVRAGNSAAHALYAALGFALAGRRRAYYENGEDAVRYSRTGPLASG